MCSKVNSHGIRRCAAGRFVACLDCRLSVEFPAGPTRLRNGSNHIRAPPQAGQEMTILLRKPKTRALTSFTIESF
jgi:hypothetical protein